VGGGGSLNDNAAGGTGGADSTARVS
jgi:hypothetical protein